MGAVASCCVPIDYASYFTGAKADAINTVNDILRIVTKRAIDAHHNGDIECIEEHEALANYTNSIRYALLHAEDTKLIAKLAFIITKIRRKLI
jgi:hypothetical protein